MRTYVCKLLQNLYNSFMGAQENSLKYKVLIGVLAILLIGLALYSYSMYKDRKSTVAGLEKQRVEIQKELTGLATEYEEVITENELKDERLIEAKSRIDSLLKEVEESKANIALIERYRTQINQLQAERKILFARADSLVKANERLVAERDSTYSALYASQRKLDSISLDNLELSKAVNQAKSITARKLKANAIILRNNGRIVTTKRSGRADDIQACFTINANNIADEGERRVYVQVVNPMNNILGKQEAIEADGEVLYYSKSIHVYYENDDLDVCILADADDQDLIPGRYVINIYDGINQIGTTTIELR